MGRLFERFFDVRQGELGLVLSFFLHYCCVGMLYTFGATAGDTLFLSTLSVPDANRLLPWVYVGIAVATVATTWVFDRLQQRLARPVLVPGTLLLLAASVGVFWLALRGGVSPGFYFGLVIWLEVCALISIVLFFSLAGDYFTARDARRLYPFIAGGLPLGNMIAGALADRVVGLLGTVNLLVLVSALLAVGALVSLAIQRVARPLATEGEAASGVEQPLAPTRAILSHRYIRLIFLVSLLALTCFVLVDYQMKLVARDAYPEAEALASFFGRFYSLVGLAQLLFQFLLVGVLLRRLGIIACLMIMPALHLLMAALFFGTGFGLLAAHGLWIIAAAGFFRMTITETLEMPARELALLPLPARLRLRAQAMMGGMLAPLGQGVGGLLVASLTAAQLRLQELSVAVIVCAVLWIAALVLARPRYRETLTQSLRNNQLGVVELRALVEGERAGRELSLLLESGETAVVLFCLELLRDRPLGPLTRRVTKLVGGDDPEVAAAALALLGAQRRPEHLKVIEAALGAEAPAVRAAAVRAYCELRGERAASERRGWLDDPDPVVRHAAIAGLGRSSGAPGVALVRPAVERLTGSAVVEDRVSACELIAEQGGGEATSLLVGLLDDEVERVRAAAIEAVGEVGAFEGIPRLVTIAEGEPSLRRLALEALSRMPEAAVDPITAVASRAELDEGLRVQLFHALAEIGGEAAARALWDFFRAPSSITSGVSAGRALQRLALSGRALELDDDQLERLLAELTGKIELLSRAVLELRGTDDVAAQMVRDHQWLEVERLFQLLSLRHDPRALTRIRYNLDSPQPVFRANALELLEELLPRRLSLRVVPLLEPLIDGGEGGEGGEGLTEETVEALRRQVPWLRVVTRVSVFGSVQSEESAEMSVDLAWAEELALAPIQAQVADLKKVPLFAEVPADDLIPIAREVRSLHLEPGDALFRQGDPGDAMFLVQRGLIRVVVDEDLEVARVGADEVIGEMAVIDGLPRSADCLAAEATDLLEISVDSFDALIRGHSSAAIAVLRTISARLRRSSAKASRPPSGPKEASARGEPVCRSSRGRCRPGGGLTELIARCSFLQEVELFAGLSTPDLVKIAELCTSLSLFAGEALFEQGDRGDSMVIIREGAVSVQIDGHEIARQGVGDCLGEMALIDGLPRSATCVVAADAVLLSIAADDFALLLSVQPDIAVGLMRTLSARLRKTN